MKRREVVSGLAAFLVLGVGGTTALALTPKEELGKKIYFDKRLSSPGGQACADCHDPKAGFTGGVPGINKHTAVYPGAVRQRYGNRKPPAAAYAGDSPVLSMPEPGFFVGGMFWDGRATGEVLGDPLAEQAMGPFLNPLEQNMADPTAVCLKVESGSYASLFETAWGPGSLDCSPTGVSATYERIARSIAAFERSSEVNAYTAKYDAVLAGQASFTAQEEEGRLLFEGKGKCAACHPAPLFTDFTYDNLGVPRNPDNPFYGMLDYNPEGAAWVDPGLGGFLASRSDYAIYANENMGKHKVPTLRNAGRQPGPGFAKAYMHNGVLKTLKDVVHFYNTRDVAPWPPPEVVENMNMDELGNLGLTEAEEDAIVAFLLTLSDGWRK